MRKEVRMFGKKRNFIIEENALKDGRVIILFKKGIIEGNVYIPKVEDENVLKNIRRLKECENIKVKEEEFVKDKEKILKFAKRKKCLIFISGKKEISQDNRIKVVNMDELFEELAPTCKPGDERTVRIVKRGKDEKEGIGYLKNGMKVVVKDGSKYIGKHIDIIIKGMISTPAGKVVFAEPKYKE